MVRSKDWNSALEDARVVPGADSLLDGMDRTVDRLLYPREESKVNVSGRIHNLANAELTAVRGGSSPLQFVRY